MTRYEQGFLNKCAEAGVGVGEAMELLKSAAIPWGRIAEYMGKAKSAIGNSKLVGRAANRLRGSWADRATRRGIELIGGGNANARRFTRETTALKDLIANAQSIGDVDTAKKLSDQLNRVNSVVNKSRSGIFRRPRHSTAAESRAWFDLFDPYSNSLNRKQVAKELNKVRWARRGLGAAAAAPVVAGGASMLGGGGADDYDFNFDENGNLMGYQGPQQGYGQGMPRQGLEGGGGMGHGLHLTFS